MAKHITSVVSATRLTQLAQQLVKQTITHDDVVIDGTVGNGIDTIWLRRCIDDFGTVLGFDIQSCALDNARTNLTEAFGNLPNNVYLHHRCHSDLIKTLRETSHSTIGAAMFNLGYLPGGDHTIVTRVETTVSAIDQAISVLRYEGIITVMVYLGQNNDEAELNAVTTLYQKLDPAFFSVTHYTAEGGSERAPHLFVLVKTHK